MTKLIIESDHTMGTEELADLMQHVTEELYSGNTSGIPTIGVHWELTR